MLDRGADGRGRLHPGDVMVADVERTLALEPITAPIVVYGHSAGGAVAAAVAADLGPRVAGVLLEDPFWRLPVTPFQDSDVAREAESRLLRLQALEAPARIAAIRAEWPDWAADEVEAQATSSALVQPAIVRDGDLIPTVPWPELVAQLISARVRVTVVTGTGRVGMTAAHQRVLRDAGAHVEVIAGADHFVRRDRPAAFRLVLEEFLHTVSSRSPHE